MRRSPAAVGSIALALFALSAHAQAPSDSMLAAALVNCDAHAQQQIDTEMRYYSYGDRQIRAAQIEQERQQCRRYAEAAAAQRMQDARNQTLDQDRGYQRITVEAFVLDGKELAAKSAKVSLSGSYVGQNDNGFLFADTRAVIMATKYPNMGEQPKVPLLTDGASRNFRQRLLMCKLESGHCANRLSSDGPWGGCGLHAN